MRILLSGLVVDAAFSLPGARPAPAGAPPDLRVTHAGQRPVPADIAEGERLQAVATQRGPFYSTVRRPDGEVLLRLHGRVDFEIAPDCHSVRAWTDPACEPEMLGLLVSGNLLAVVLALRGETVLHASAVEVEGRVLAFVAPSGLGKSTLAALACARGARFVTDDVLRPQFGTNGAVYCWPGVTENRLRRDVADLSADHAGALTRTSVDGRAVWRPPASTSGRCPLHAVVLPRPVRDGHRLDLQPLPPGEAVLELTRRPRILGWIDETVRAETFANLARLARAVPVYRAGVPWGPPFDPAVIDELLALTHPGAQPAA